MTTVVFTLTGLNGESIPYTQFKVEAASPDGAYDPEYIVPSPVTFTTDALGKATVELAATNAPYFITRMTGSVDDFIAYKFFVPESTQPIAANMLYVDLGKQLKLSTDRSLYALIEAKVSMLHALDMAQTLSTIVPAETIRTATNYAGARLLTGIGTGVSPRLQILGSDSAADGGGGVFVWDGVSNAADDGAIVLKPTAFTVEAGRWIREFDGTLNVKWFGARGDGVTDDSAAFQAAITYAHSMGGGQIDIPFGRGEIYRANIVLAGHQGIHLNGMGWTKQSYGPTTEVLKGVISPYTANLPVITIGDNGVIGYATLTSGIILSNLNLSGLGTTRGQIGLKITGGAYRCIYNNVSILGFTNKGLWTCPEATKDAFYQYFTGMSIICGDEGAACIYLDGSADGLGAVTNVTSHYFDKVTIATGNYASCRGIVVKSAQASFADTYVQLASGGYEIGLELIKETTHADPSVTCTNLSIDTAYSGGVQNTVKLDIAGFTDAGSKPLSQYLRGTFSIDGSLLLQDGSTNTVMTDVYSWHRNPILSNPKIVNVMYITNLTKPEYSGNYFAAGGGATPTVRLYAPNNFELASGNFILPGNSESPNGDGISSKSQFNRTLYVSTSVATAVRLTADGGTAVGTNVPTVPLNASVAFTGHVHARQSTADDIDGEVGMWTIAGILTRNSAGAVSLVSAVIPTVISRSTNATSDNWTVAVTADDTLKALNVSFTSGAAKDIHVVCSLILSEIVYA